MPARSTVQHLLVPRAGIDRPPPGGRHRIAEASRLTAATVAALLALVLAVSVGLA